MESVGGGAGHDQTANVLAMAMVTVEVVDSAIGVQHCLTYSSLMKLPIEIPPQLMPVIKLPERPSRRLSRL